MASGRSRRRPPCCSRDSSETQPRSGWDCRASTTWSSPRTALPAGSAWSQPTPRPIAVTGLSLILPQPLVLSSLMPACGPRRGGQLAAAQPRRYVRPEPVEGQCPAGHHEVEQLLAEKQSCLCRTKSEQLPLQSSDLCPMFEGSRLVRPVVVVR